MLIRIARAEEVSESERSEVLGEVLKAKGAWIEAARERGEQPPQPQYRPTAAADKSLTGHRIVNDVLGLWTVVSPRDA